MGDASYCVKSRHGALFSNYYTILRRGIYGIASCNIAASNNIEIFDTQPEHLSIFPSRNIPINTYLCTVKSQVMIVLL